jgi:hypothetical protein
MTRESFEKSVEDIAGFFQENYKLFYRGSPFDSESITKQKAFQDVEDLEVKMLEFRNKVIRGGKVLQQALSKKVEGS